MKTKTINKNIFELSIVAGMRAMAALSILNQYLLQHPSKRLAKTPLHFIQTQKAANIFKLLATGEMLGDKLPFIPARIKPTPLFARALTGLLIGTVLTRTKTKKVTQGAVLGLVGAVASSYLFYFLRKNPASKGAFQNALWGTLEDGLVLKQGNKLLSKA